MPYCATVAPSRFNQASFSERQEHVSLLNNIFIMDQDVRLGFIDIAAQVSVEVGRQFMLIQNMNAPAYLLLDRAR